MREDLIERLRNAVGVGPFLHAVSDDAPAVVTAGLLREAAELARRVEDAPTVLVSEWIWEDVPEGLDGQRVRIVPEAGQGVDGG